MVASLSADSFIGRIQAADAHSTGAPSAVPPELANHRDYRIVRELGRGGMGVVYLARNTLMDRDEVLKVAHRGLLEKPGASDRFLQEIRAAAQLMHVNVVRAYSVLRPGNLLVFAMEYVPGDDLARIVSNQGALPIAHACQYGFQVAQGLQHAHEKGLVHRDIKPSNLILSKDGKKPVVKILDFGLAKMTSEVGFAKNLTGSNKMMGTPDYIAPEQILDAAAADIRADIYSLGCSMYFLLSGAPPFAGGSLYEVLHAHSTVQERPLNLVRPEVPAELAAVVAKMMAKDPARRHQEPGDVCRDLLPFVKPGAVSAPVGRPVRPRPPSKPPGAAVRTQGPIDAPKLPPVALAESDPFAFAPQTMIADSPLTASRKPRGKNGRLLRIGLAIALAFGIAGVLLVALGVFRVETPDGIIVLNGVPPDAEVLVDGNRHVSIKPAGNGSLIEIRVQPGTHKLQIRHADFKTYAQDVAIDAGGRTPLQIHLEPRLVTPVIVPVAPPPVPTTPKKTPIPVPPVEPKDSTTPDTKPEPDVAKTNSEEIRGRIRTIDGDRLTISQRENAEDFTFTVTASATIAQGRFDKDTSKTVAGDPLEGGLKNEIVTAGAIALLTIENDKVVRILVTPGKAQNAQPRVVPPVPAPVVDKRPKADPGFKLIFNGEDLTGWRPDHSNYTKWSVDKEEGTLIGKNDIFVAQSWGAIVYGGKVLKNFDLKFQVKAIGRSSGMALRDSTVGVNHLGYGISLEGKILGFQNVVHKSGSVTLMRDENLETLLAPSVSKNWNVEDWNTVEAILTRNSIRTIINGVEACRFTDPANRYTQGELRVLCRTGAEIYLRQVQVKELP